MTKVAIICSKHGEFEQTPLNHLHGMGCPICNESKGEKLVAEWLAVNNINFEREVCIRDFNKYKRFDFYLPELRMYIEYDGIQHFECLSYFGGKKSYEKRIKIDKLRVDYCKNSGIRLHIITYLDNIEESLCQLLLK
jgi:very-short-patch-repair endonuclease